MQRHRIAALLLLPSIAACTPFTTGRARDDQAATMQSEDPALRQAMEKAQATLDDFLTKAKQQPAGISGYALKVRVQEGRDVEYFWVEEFTWSDGSFTGKINNEPRVVRSVKPGQTYQFSRSQVADWKYRDDKVGKTFGNFTACALSSKEPAAQAAETQRRDGLDCS